MTEPRRPTEWDDERVEAAFGARAGRAIAPRDLTATSIEALRASRRPGRLAALRPRAIGFATMAAVAAVAVAGIGLVTSPPGPAAATLLERVGLTPMTVSEAIAIRDLMNDDREIAVRGWFSPAPPISCPAPASFEISPIDLQCPLMAQWLLEEPEQLVTRSASSIEGRAPVGPAIHPVLPFLDPDSLPTDGDPLAELVLVGHFDDRRAVMCDSAMRDACQDNFVVDRIVSIDGVEVEPSFVESLERLEPFGRVRPAWTYHDVDRIVRSTNPDVEILARTVIAAGRIGEIEPSLGTGALGILDRTNAWIVTALQPRAGQPPRLRTFLLVDDTVDETYEAVPWSESNVGFAPIRLLTPTHAPEDPTPPATTPNPTVVTRDVAFPETWSGLPIRSVAEVFAALPRLDDGPSQAVAIKGWYVAPDPTLACPELPDPPGPVEQPCPEGRHWLLDAPERLWDDPGPPWIDRQPTGPALNPIVPADLPFDIPNLWFDTGPYPLPVVVIGHFRDPRIAFGGDPNSLVVDALVWRAGVATANVPVGPVDGALDDPLAVMIRAQRDAGSSIDAWLSLTSGAALVEDDPSGDPLPPELATAERVWVVRRLVERDGGGHTIERAYTADGSNRVWSSSLCCMVWLQTRLLTALGGPAILETLDYPGDILAIRPGLPEGAASWIEGQGPPETGIVSLGVIEGRPNELRIAWLGSECDATWQLTWRANQVLLWPRERQPTCSEAGVRREVVLSLDHPVDLKAISVSNGGTGG